jgi:tetratricopeptide (TPR) repeat protein
MDPNARLERLKVLVEKNPQDVFAWYGLAMEHKNRQQHQEAILAFEELLTRDPGYTAAYLHYGTALRQAGEEEKAQEVLSKGVQVAEEKGEQHARDELLEALGP